ncbi:hypothetical protein D5125_13635 [Magnetovirga frankeli]|uniref:hypothetical protein n=1 Tax=Magnetovirga frankeli TaxID=947516 RepID=UPI001293B986|nr:hypothetical protein D5125_13635 [gamma proteobacterium SS-5]
MMLHRASQSPADKAILKAGPGQSEQPELGRCYRDNRGHSFVVQALGGRILIEYANGEFRTLGRDQWQQLQPVPALF